MVSRLSIRYASESVNFAGSGFVLSVPLMTPERDIITAAKAEMKR